MSNGGVISLVEEENRIQLYISVAKIKALDLKVSANLMEVARVVK